MKKVPLISFLLVTLTAVLIYSNTFSSPFQYDDGLHIVENDQLRGLTNFWPVSGTRYIGELSFALNYHFGKLDVFGYHLVNLTIHIVNGLLVWWLVFFTLKTPAMAGAGGLAAYRDYIALASALLFVAHPVQTQAVTYIVQRYASLATLFYLLSLVMYLRARLFNLNPETGGPRRVPAILCYLVALMSAVLAMKTKEISFTLPLIIVLYEFTFLGDPERKFRLLDWKRLAGIVPFLGTLLIIPYNFLKADRPLGDPGGELGDVARETEAISREDYLLTQFKVLVTYLRLLAIPVNQNLDYDYPISRSFDGQVFFSFLLLFMLFGVAVYLFYISRQAGRRGWRLIAFGIFWFFITLSVESSLIPIQDVIYEHRLYLPSAGVSLAFASGAFYLYETIRPKWSPFQLICILFLVTVVPLGIASYKRNGVWKAELTLWEDVVRKSPYKGRGHMELGRIYSNQGRIEDAAREYGIALKLSPNIPIVRYNLGVFYVEQGRLEEAGREYRTALRLAPDYFLARINLGTVYVMQGRLDEAYREYRIVLKLAPNHPKLHYNLGVVYHKQGRLEEAAAAYKTALRLAPDDAQVRMNLGTLYASQGRLDEAVREFTAVLKLSPNDPMARYNLGRVYQSNGMTNEARRYFESALKLKPDLTAARQALQSLGPP